MKIAAQTIGLDLVAVKPTPGPKIDLLYIDFQYDDTRLGDQDERPQVFKMTCSELSSIQTSLSKEIIVIDLSVKHNTGANYWDGILIYTTSDSGIVFH
jgi:hypothetical protein